MASQQNNIFMVPASRFLDIQARVEKINVRARKTGAHEMCIIKVGSTDNGAGKEPTIHVWAGFEDEYKIAGYKLVGRVDHGILGEAIVLGAKEFDIERFRECRCDHCGIKRQRNSTFIVENEQGELLQVGSTCLADFLGTNVEEILRSYESLRRVIYGDRDPAGSTYFGYDLETFIACCFAAIDIDGFVSREASTDQIMTTATHATLIESSRRKHITEQNQADAVEAIDLVRASEPKNNFETNLKTIADTGVVSGKHVNIASCIALALVRKRGNDARKLAAEKARVELAASKHFLAVGDMFDGEVVVQSVRNIETAFSFTTLVRMLQGNNLIVTFATGSFNPEQGSTIRIRGRVKKNDTYNGVDQTILTRVRVVA